MPSVKVDIEEVIKIGLGVEQRVLEVLPAAMLRFPKSFLHWDKVPEKLATIFLHNNKLEIMLLVAASFR